MKIFCRRIFINDTRILSEPGPILLAANHPDSFLDAIIVGSQFARPVHFLARGDAFRNPIASRILRGLNMIPIYRLSEGREYLALNDATFRDCHELLKDGAIVLIFAEGLCQHQWALRPLKKGCARIAINAFEDPQLSSRFKVIPVGLSYNSFERFGKMVEINFGTPLRKEAAQGGISVFNLSLSENLSGLIFETNDPATANRKLRLRTKMANASPSRVTLMFTSIILLPFAVLGWFFNAVLYYPLRVFAKKKTAGTVFYDSVLYGSLLLTYPIYYIVLNSAMFLIVGIKPLTFATLAAPLLAWLLVHWHHAVVVLMFRESENDRVAMAADLTYPVQRKESDHPVG